MQLPALRQELDLFEGPRQAHGEPSWVIHDPARQQFFSIDWKTFEILKHWELNDAKKIIESIESECTLWVSLEDIEATLKFLSEQQLLQTCEFNDVQKLIDRSSASRQNWLTWLIHHYLFFRIPLWKPDRWLEKTQSQVQFFFSKKFLWLTLFAFSVGLIETIQQWEKFHGYLLDTLTWEGLTAYAFALVCSKLMHELGHAYSLKRHGGRVPTMGVAFLVMWPMAYTDTNEAWKIPDRQKRLQISSAGIVTEMVIAAWALLLWSLLPDGSIRSAMFFLAVVSLSMTIALNASPFMRFDGYYILCDLIGIHNLHQRSFELARWQLREWLFKLNQPKPEVFSNSKHNAMVLFALGVWLYRLVLFLGIAVLVYTMFTKLLGLLLFAIEIYWFIWFPIRSELRVWWEHRKIIRSSKRSRITAAVIGLTLIIFMAPMPTRILVTAKLQPGAARPVYMPGPAVLNEWLVSHGDRVEKGQILAKFDAPDASLQLSIAQAKWQRLNWHAASSAHQEAASRSPLALSQSQLRSAVADFDRAQMDFLRYNPVAPISARFYYTDPDLQPGQWINKNEQVGILVGDDAWVIETWVNEDQVRRLRLGQSAIFYSESIPFRLNAIVSDIDLDATRVLQDGQLTAPFGGHILVREQQGKWIPEYAVYRVRLALTPNSSVFPQSIHRGQLSIQGDASTLGGQYLKHALSIVIRELQP